MRRCPKCQREAADGILFCQNCGTPLPVAQVAQQVPMSPARKSGGKKGVMAVLWTSLVVNVLLVALLVTWTLGVFGPSARERSLQEQVEQLEEQVQDLESQLDDRLSGGMDQSGPDDPDEESEPTTVPDPTTEPAPTTVPDATVPAETEPPRQVFTIRVWVPLGDQEEGNDWLAEMQARFEQKHPEYDIIWENDCMSEGDAANVISADVTGAADVYMFANDQLGHLVNCGGLVRLDGSARLQVLNDNYQLRIDSVTHTDGEIYGFPTTNNTWFTYYNTDVFTAEDVKSLDTMLSKGKVCVPFNIGWNAGCFFLGTGGTVFGSSGRDASAGIDFGGEKGYTAAKKMIQVADHPNCVAGGMDVGRLLDGEVGACFSGSWDREMLELYMGDKLGVARLPSFEADGKTYNMTALSGTKCVGVNPCSDSVAGKQEVCMEFAAFLASQEGQLLRYEMRGVIPAAKTLAGNEMIKADPVAVAELETMAQCAVLQSALPEMSRYWSPMEIFGRGCVDGDISMENYKDMVDQLNEMLNDEGL